jgi:signal transduction histidine kinase
MFIGIKTIEDILLDAIDRYEVLSGCYIGVDERLQTGGMEDTIGGERDLRMGEICEAFGYFLTQLIDAYAALVPYGEIVEEFRREVGRIDRRVVAWFIPLTLFKIVLEPLTRELKGDELRIVRMSIDIQGIYLNRKGGLVFHTLCRLENADVEQKFTAFLFRFLHLAHKKEAVRHRIMESFRGLPPNIKRTLYRDEFIKRLPAGILDEEKIVLSSKEKLIDELIARKEKLEDAYDRLAEAKLDKMKADFIDIIAHELKTPLTSIKTYTDLMLRGKLGPITPVQREKLGRMARNVERLTTLIDDMLQIPSFDAKELELRKEAFAARGLVEKIIADVGELAHEKGQRITVDVADDVDIFGDKTLIEKAIKNIVVNAVKYTPGGGSISITAAGKGENTHIAVADSGKGIAGKDLERIFEPFYSLESGAGLGLSIAKNIVESHGGTIWAESTPNRGSTFHVKLRGKKHD